VGSTLTWSLLFPINTYKDIEAPEPAPETKKAGKWFLPSFVCSRFHHLSHQLILLLLYCSTSHYCLFRHHHNSRLRPICMHVLVHHATLPPSTVPCIPQSEMFFHWVVCLCSTCSLCELHVMIIDRETFHCVEIVSVQLSCDPVENN